MVTEHGAKQWLLGRRDFKLRLIVGGQKLDTLFEPDPGYPSLDDRDPGNSERGANVLTYRYTIPKGFEWGPTPATEAELWLDGTAFRFRLPAPLAEPRSYPAVIYANLLVRQVA